MDLNRVMMWSFPVGKIFGIEVRVHWSFPLFILGELGRTPGQEKLALGWLALLFVTVLIHELGHCFMARRLGIPVHKILLWPLGGLAYTGASRSARDDIKVSAAGPAVHLPLALLFTGGLLAMHQPLTLDSFNPLSSAVEYSDSYWVLLLEYGLKIQSVLFCLNLLLPVYPLDGGRIFVSVLSLRWPAKRVAYAASGVSLAALLVIVWFGQWVMALFIGLNALQLFMLARQNQLEMHPMFHDAPRIAAPAPKRHLRLVQPVCPYCQRPVSAKAQMCGFCERSLPQK